MSSNGKDNGCVLKSFEKNAYFFGKLMTARDMTAEQEMHDGKLYAVNRLVLGPGQVCGLGLAKDPEVKNGELWVTISPGMAIDCCGRLIVVDSEKTVKVANAAGSTYPATMYLYLSYDECKKEAVPASDEDGCKEKCCYNRILEIFTVSYKPEPPKPLDPKVVFPTETEAKSEWFRREKIARDYYVDNLMDAPGDCSGATVFLGVVKSAGAGWVKDDALTNQSRQVVYDNRMLYDILVAHILNFGNPHGVTAKDTGALVSINGVSNPGDNINLTSTDSTIAIAPSVSGKSISLTISSSVKADIDAAKGLKPRVDALEEELKLVRQYLMDKSLKYKLSAFPALAKRLELGKDSVAYEIVKAAKFAVDKRYYADEKKYIDIMEKIAAMEYDLAKEIEKVVTKESLVGYLGAIERLKKEMGSGSATSVAVAQDEVCEMAEFLESAVVTVKVPKVIEETYDNAIKILGKAGLKANLTGKEASASPIDTVIKQSPAEGTLAHEGDSVDLVISSGNKIKVPDTVNKLQKDAEDAIVKAGLKVGEEKQVISADVKPGFVAQQSPVAGTEVDPGTPVALSIAQAKIVVPNLIKLKEQDAETKLKAAGLKVGNVGTQISGSVGYVIRQSPVAGTEADPGTAVDLTVGIRRPGH